MKGCMYLRKSRADIEAEKTQKFDTLEKHRSTLIKFADDNNLNIVEIKEEIVSGETLIHRPKMLELLKDVEKRLFDFVLVMDIDRLGRGNMQEQGLILETFKTAKTKIITPRKTYDLSDEFDEEYSEFEAFMARKELKLINRRLQRGRLKSIESGNYIATLPPFGYEIYKTDKYRSLKPHPEQADIIKMIFNLYVDGLGGNKIANHLNELGFKTYTGKEWRSSSVLNILKNSVYTGKVVWKKKEIKKSTTPGKSKDSKTRDKSKWVICEGKHDPLISEEIFNKAQDILTNRYHVPYHLQNGIANPLAGLIKCKLCGASMVLRPYDNIKNHQIMCYKNCSNKSSKLIYIEERIINGLKEWLKEYKSQWNLGERKKIITNTDILEKNIINLNNELAELNKQKENLHDLLERGVYDIDTFIERNTNITSRIEETKNNISKCKKAIKFENKKVIAKEQIIPTVEHVLDVYYKTDNSGKKNTLLKSVLAYTEYFKTKTQRNDEFTLILHPKLPDK